MLKRLFFTILFLLFFSFPQKAFANVVINEVFVHPGSGGHEWVEIYNSDSTDLTSYFIDDDTNFIDDIGSSKKQLTSISNGPYSVFILSSSMFNNDGDSVVLFDPGGGIIDQYSYGEDPGTDIAIGRNPDESGSFSVLASATQGSVNSEVLPTATLTPTEIPTPTRTLTPTRMPTPIKNPTPTKVPTATNIPTKSSNSSTQSKTAIKDVSKKSASNGAYPTVVLGAKISASPTAQKLPNEKLLVKEGFHNAGVTISFVIGGLFLAACGILVYRRVKHARDTNDQF